MKLMILDGNSIVNRAFYGVRMLNAPDGTPTNAIFGFLNILQRMLDEQKPDALCVAFDRREPTFRHKAYEGYKAQRKPMPEELAVQMPLLKETLDAMGIRRYELAGYEADDILGTAARICRERGWPFGPLASNRAASARRIRAMRRSRLPTRRRGWKTRLAACVLDIANE